MRVYHFINAEFGLDNIRNQRLKIARINNLNDPFEFLGVEASDPKIRRAFQNTKNEFSKSKGILCFSKSWSNPVQWIHYPDNHRGICLGFDMPDNLLRTVQYVRSRLSFDREKMGHDTFATEFVMQVSSSKFMHWRYEQEMRSFVELDHKTINDGLYFMDFSPNLLLSEVIIGSCSTVTRSDLRDALGNLSEGVSLAPPKTPRQNGLDLIQRSPAGGGYETVGIVRFIGSS